MVGIVSPIPSVSEQARLDGYLGWRPTDLIPTALIVDLDPISFGDRSYSFWIVGEEVPRLDTFFEDFLVGVEDRDSVFV